LGNVTSRKYNIVLTVIWPEPYKKCVKSGKMYNAGM